MADVIKTGQVVIDFVRGKNEVKAPDVSPVVVAKEKEIDLNKQIVEQENRVKEAAAWAAAARQAAAQKAARAEQEAAEEAKRHSDALQQAAAADAAAIEQAARDKQAAEEAAAQAAEKAAAKAAALRKAQLEGANQLAEGMLKVGRAVALAGAAGSDEMKKLIENLVAAQIAVDIFTGASTALKGLVAWLGAARIATLGLTGAIATLEAVAAPVLLVVAALAAAYYLLSGNAEEAAKAAEETAQKLRQANDEMERAQANAIDRERAIQNEVRQTLSLREQQARLEAANPAGMIAKAKAFGDFTDGARPEDAANTISYAQGIGQAAIDNLKAQQQVQKSLADEQTKALDGQRQLIELKQKELETAEEILKAEEKKKEAFVAQFGALSKGEQERLKRIDKKINAGEDLTRSELNALGKAGGLAAEAAARIYADRGRKAGGDQLLFGGQDAAAKALANVQNAAGALSEVTGGLAADAALRAIKDRKAEVEKEFASFLQTNATLLRAALAQMATLSNRQKIVEITLANQKARQK